MDTQQQANHARFADHFKRMAEMNLDRVLQLESDLTRHVSYISFAMIVVSLLAVDKLLTANGSLRFECALVACWVLCVVALVFMAAMIYQSANFKDSVNNIYFQYLYGSKDIRFLYDEWEKATQKYGAYGLAVAGIVCLLAGLCALLAFISFNIL